MLDDVSGYACSEGVAAAFAAHLSVLLRNHAERKRLGESARVFAHRFRWERSLEPLCDAYRDAATAHAADRVSGHAAVAEKIAHH
jgi:glycosyltransferase involved in cell wall biosynthesis